MAPDAPEGRLAAELAAQTTGLERELAEIDMLVGQARTEAVRHEQKRAAAAERLATVSAATDRDLVDPIELANLNAQLITLTRRAAVMESQIDVLEGKRKVLVRFRDALAEIRRRILEGGSDEGSAGAATDVGDGPLGAAARRAGSPASPQAVARLVLTAQEDLRRDIARAMHDGPAQSLTNIVLQAQIVERFIERDNPVDAKGELRELEAMVQRTLEATKAFIFDVRPMVLDDLGLVPTLRRLARDRGRQGAVPVEFDSFGRDRRLPIEVESAVFRIVDEAIAVLVATRPERVTLALDWGDEELEARVAAPLPPGAAEPEQPPPPPSPDLPPALAAFLEERRAARPDGGADILPAELRRELVERAASVGGRFSVSPDGREMRVVVPAAGLPAEP